MRKPLCLIRAANRVRSAQSWPGRRDTAQLCRPDAYAHATTYVLIKSGEPKSRVNGRPCGKRPKRTFAEVMVEWATSIEASVSAKTVQRYACSSEPYLKGKMLHEVSRRFIADVVLGATLASTMQPSTRSQYPPYFIRPRPQLVPTTSTLVAMKENRRSVTRLSCRRRARRACGRSLPRHADIVHIAIATGAREEELLKATRGQVDHENRQMTLIG
jgi:hypothetical protein